MRYALLSLIQKNPQTGQVWGLSPLAEGNIAFAQVDLAKLCGATHILCLVEAVPQGVETVADYAASLGMKWTLVRAITDISVHILADDDLILVADGLFLAPNKVAGLTMERAPFIATFVPGEQDKALVSNFERMDINHIWAGVAILRGADLFDIRNLPADWDMQSALLRIAVQKQYRRIVWPVRDMETGKVQLGEEPEFGIITVSATDGEGRQARPSFAGRLLRTGLGKMIAQRIWAVPAARNVMGGLSALFSVGAAVCAWFSLPAMGMTLLALSVGLAAFRTLLFNNFIGLRESSFVQILQVGLNTIVFLMLLALAEKHGALLEPLFAGGVILGLAVLADAGSLAGKARQYLILMRSKALFLICAIGAAVIGQLVHLTMIWALLLLGALLFDRMSNENVIETEV